MQQAASATRPKAEAAQRWFSFSALVLTSHDPPGRLPYSPRPTFLLPPVASHSPPSSHPVPPLPALSAPSCLRLSSLTYLQHASCFMVTWSRAFHAHAHTHILACLLKHNITEHTHTSAHPHTHAHTLTHSGAHKMHEIFAVNR